MRRYQYIFSTAEKFDEQLTDLKHRFSNSKTKGKLLFHIFTEFLDEENILSIRQQILNYFPDANVVGASTNGNIFYGQLAEPGTIISCTQFEKEDTNCTVVQYYMDASNIDQVCDNLIAKINELGWVKAVELVVTIRNMSMSRLCDRLNELKPEINIFGGGAFSEDINTHAAFVISTDSVCCDQGIAFVLYGGPSFTSKAIHITGWKPLGRKLVVSKARESRLYELDNAPAYSTYYRYLKIANDPNFFKNTLEFPFVYEQNGELILRAPVSCNPDGSLEMTSDIKEGTRVKIAYGDPWTILDSVYKGGQIIEKYNSEAINIYSCAARKFFWGLEACSQETMPFENIASTTGFYTSGEFIREGGIVFQHNVTLIVVSMSENIHNNSKHFRVGGEYSEGQISLVNRLANFIGAATEELAEANKQLEIQSITDGLTQLYNRTEIQRRIDIAVRDSLNSGKAVTPFLIMLDIDNFKKVNDTYGHAAGDKVLRKLSELMKEIVAEYYPEASVGRWGGEEFMILIPNTTEEEAYKLAERIRTEFSETPFELIGNKTISLGVTKAIKNETPEGFANRADENLYISKTTGKNKTTTDNNRNTENI